MFFTDELLMAKRGSLGVIWLVSTLGPRNKRVNRKALEKVEITHTCGLIASPPEPLALRLSGQLLVGVVRVYSRNYEHFYSDVQTFDSALRRSIALDLGTVGRNSGEAELDLPGGRRTRLEMITFADYMPGLEEYLGIDLEFAKIDWLNPDFSAMDHERRHTTPLDSLKPQSQHFEDNIDMEDPRSKRRTPLHTNPNINNDRLPTFKPYEPEESNVPDDFNPINLDLDLDLDIGLPDIPKDLEYPKGPLGPIGASSDGTMPPGFVSDNLVDPEGFDVGPTSTDLGPAEVLPVQLHSPSPPFTRKRSSGQEASDVEAQLFPASKPKKKGRVKRTKFDHDLELDLDLARMEAAYIDAMAQNRRELKFKAHKKEVAKEAQRLLGTADNWFKFLDLDMSSFIDSFSTIGQFKWQLDVKARSNPPPLKADEPQVLSESAGPHDIHYQDIPNIHGLLPSDQYELELPRSASDLPWGAPSDFTDPPDQLQSGETTPLGIRTPRVSDMSPLEISIRKSQRQSSITGDATGRGITNRSRSGSVFSINVPGHNNIQLASEDDGDQLPEHDLTTRFTQGHPLAPKLLASLEDQCRNFFIYVDKTMLWTNTDELELADLAARGHSKRVAAIAFHNCLTLATKRLLNLSQETAYGPITIRISSV
ncbi:hypothetical protein CspeluHIS016_0309270 [Cutaneotrichosporon spelunceum]|uniref:Rad21/Rec8-like protein N-terminal domain-containing protein n=1 Tax=Cutaneotrichosporon spelunceum TaxID=1672016 RepID=A0AAD3TV67_9TREE|nr:hypothetical protein CspeluHIS016_0309270 [Cutaneotrichosporon spelunceum]